MKRWKGPTSPRQAERQALRLYTSQLLLKMELERLAQRDLQEQKEQLELDLEMAQMEASGANDTVCTYEGAVWSAIDNIRQAQEHEGVPSETVQLLNDAIDELWGAMSG